MWDYCLQCKKFDDGEYTDRPCSGYPYDYQVDGNELPCENYERIENEE